MQISIKADIIRVITYLVVNPVLLIQGAKIGKGVSIFVSIGGHKVHGAIIPKNPPL